MSVFVFLLPDHYVDCPRWF